MAKDTLDIPAGLDGYARVHRPTGRRRQMHRHDELEFNLVTRGRASYLMTDRRYDLTPGTLIWLFPECEHVLLGESADFECWIVVFAVDLVRRTCRGEATAYLCEGNPRHRHCLSIDAKRARQLHELCERMNDAQDEPDHFNAALAYLLMAAWDATERAETMVGADVHPAVERTAARLRDEAADCDLPTLARHAGLSASRLSRLFATQTGMSITAYRNRQRVERFLARYGRGQRVTMLDAALGAGFGSYPQFHRVFKQVMGTSPAGYFRGRGRGEGE